MKKLIILINLLLGAWGIFAQTQWSPTLENKIHKAVHTTFQHETPTIEAVTFQSSCTTDDRSNFANKLFTVQSENGLLGYMYVDQAPSMKDIFDYVVFFEPDFSIKKSKVLIYREQHGRQIGTVRWLSQFNNMTPNDNPRLGEEIDGISGATISCTNMTKAVAELLQHISVAHTACFQ